MLVYLLSCPSRSLVYLNRVALCVCVYLHLCARISNYFPLDTMFAISLLLYIDPFYCFILMHKLPSSKCTALFLSVVLMTGTYSALYSLLLKPSLPEPAQPHICSPATCTKAYTEAQVEKMPRLSTCLVSRR